MRKLIALALVAAMMLTLVPVVALAADSDIQTLSNYYEYYFDPDLDGDKILYTTNPAKASKTDEIVNLGSPQKGGITYVQAKYDRFVKWQVPGNVLTGAESSFNIWIKIVDTIQVSNVNNGTIVYIDGYPYTVADGCITYTFYTLPVRDGTTVTRQLRLYNASGTLLGSTTVSLVYEDMYNVKGTVKTQGINTANTYASITDDKITVQVVYSNLVPKMSSTNSTNTGYSTISYYPVEILYTLVDKDGNKYPDYTRVDIDNLSSSNLAVNTRGSLEEVANQTGWYYLMDSEMLIVKRFSPNGVQGDTLSEYQKAAMKYSGLQSGVYTPRAGTVYPSESIISEPNALLNQQLSFFRTDSWGGLDNTVVSGQDFNPYRIYSWQASRDLGATSSNGLNEDAIRAAIDYAIECYFTDTANQEIFGRYAFTQTDGDDRVWVTPATRGHEALPARSNNSNEWYRDITFRFEKAYNVLTGANGTEAKPYLFAGSNDAVKCADYNGTVRADAIGAVNARNARVDINTFFEGNNPTCWYAAALYAYNALMDNVTAEQYRAAGAEYSKDKAQLIWNLLIEDQLFPAGYWQASTAIELAVKAAKEAYRTEVANKLKDNLQYNSNKTFQSLDKITVRLTTPNGVVSTQTITVQYDSVTRITAKALTSLEGQEITLKVGETKDVTVKAYQDQVPVTGLPIKFQVTNGSDLITATSPNEQTVNSNTTTITAKAVGTAIVRAYIDSTNDTAQTNIIVHVVEDTPTPVTPETTDFVCKVRKLWIRSGPGTSNSKLGFFSRNDIAKVYEVVNGWAKIDYNGTVAYSSTGNGKYLSPK